MSIPGQFPSHICVGDSPLPQKTRTSRSSWARHRQRLEQFITKSDKPAWVSVRNANFCVLKGTHREDAVGDLFIKILYFFTQEKEGLYINAWSVSLTHMWLRPHREDAVGCLYIKISFFLNFY